LSPISPAEAGTVRCIGLNYRDHARECGLAIPTTPVSFLKPGTAIGHPGAIVSVPAIAQDDELDWEVELAVVLGKEAKDVTEAQAADCVLGYTVANDVRHLCPP
jgi:2-keto-4-pentenoate hydratase/2-oxohepta-3-ene-1,7-dioic acid hydratase in catechol pathway